MIAKAVKRRMMNLFFMENSMILLSMVNSEKGGC